MPRTKKQRYFDLTTIMTGLKDPFYVLISKDSILDGYIVRGDMLLVDRANKKPRVGDIVCWGDLESLTVGYYTAGDSRDDIFGVASTLIRPSTRKTGKRQRKPSVDPLLESLREQFAKLERVPENEAVSFQLESEIYRMENEADEEWPDVIRG